MPDNAAKLQHIGTHRTGGHGPERRAQHERPRLRGGGLQPHHLQGGRVPGQRGQGHEDHWHPLHRGVRAVAQAAAPGDVAGQGGQAGGRVHRSADAAPRAGRHRHRRRQLALPGQHPPREDLESKGLLFIGTGVSGGEEGARHGPSHHAGRVGGRLAAREGDLPVDLRQDARGRALLRLGRRGRRRALREDGAQRHRVRRHAAHRRGLPPHEGGAGAARTTRCRKIFAQVERGRARLVPHRDHPRDPRREGRDGQARARQHPRRRRPEGDRQVDGHLGRRPGHAHDPGGRGGVQPLPVGAEGRARGRREGADRAAHGASSAANAKSSSRTSGGRCTPPRSCPTRRATC